MNRPTPLWIVPAVVAFCLQVTGCADDSTGQPASEGTTQPSAGSTTGLGDGQDYVLLLDDESDPDQMEGKPGTYALTARGAGSPPLAVFDAPAGYSNFGFFALWPSGEEAEREDDTFSAVQYWTVHGVYPDPCDRKGKPAPEIGASVKDFAAAMAAQKLTSVTKPVPVTLDGHQGLYLETTVPSGVKIPDCEGGYYMFWQGSPGDADHSSGSPGTVERTWVIDVDGERVVLVAITAPGATDAQADELTAMVESIRFVEPQ